jgi:hypothetical protein
MKSTWQVKFLVFALLNLILAGPVAGKEKGDEDLKPITDLGRYQEEYFSAGALKFFDNSEDALRLAQLERALIRYRFLKGQIQKKPEYSSLLPQVNRRIHWLKKQMHLQEWQVAAIPPSKVMDRPKAKPAVQVPPPATPPGKARKPDTGEEGNQPPAAVTPAPTLRPPAVIAPQPLRPPAGTAPQPLRPPAAMKPGALPSPATTLPGALPAVTQPAPGSPPATVAPGAPPPPPKEEVATTTGPKEEEKAKATDKPEKVTKSEEGKEEKGVKEREETTVPPGFWQNLKNRIRGKKKAVTEEKKTDTES